MSLQFIPDLHRVSGFLGGALSQSSGLGLPPGEIFTLAVLCEKELFDIGALQRRLALPGSTLSSILNRLEKRGLLTRRASLRDRRTFEVVLTDEGHLKAQSARAFLEALEEKMSLHLSYGHVIAFTEVIEAFEKALAPAARPESAL